MTDKNTQHTEYEYPSARDVIASMVVESVGIDSPMSAEALAVASVEVGMRLDAARDSLNNTGEISSMDTKALFALLQLDIENGHLDPPR